jgi:ABC-type glycerol-3-phosphate transport system substrate-binding protein
MADSEAGVAALEFLRAMQREDRSFVPSLSGFQSGTGPDVLFAAGRTAMLMDGSWRVPNIETVAPGLDFAVAPLPCGKEAAVVSGCVMWGISSHARHKDEAWRFLRWLVRREQALEYWDTLRVAPPASLSAIASPEFRRASGVQKEGGGYEVPPMPEERFDARAAWLAYANTPDAVTGSAPGFVPVGPYQTELEEEIQRMLNEYLNPGSRESSRTVLGRVVEHMRAIIERDRAAKGMGAAG